MWRFEDSLNPDFITCSIHLTGTVPDKPSKHSSEPGRSSKLSQGSLEISSIISKDMTTPAVPILASNIWRAREDKCYDSANHKRRKLAFGTHALDNAINGGLEHGELHCITAEPERGAREIVQALLLSHLLSGPEANATMIDSTISFDVRRLFRATEVSLKDGTDKSHNAMEALGRLKIMKVFDFVGLTEAMSEVHELFAEPEQTTRSDQPSPPAPRGTVPDSEDEEEELRDDAPSVKRPAPTAKDPPRKQSESTGLLIVDNISQLILPLLKDNYVHGQAVLASFMRSIGHLTRANNLCTVLVSNAANTKAADDEQTMSLFDSCRMRSAFGNGIGYLLDVHILLHAIPRHRKKSTETEQTKDAEMVNIMEVVQDRHGARLGRWAPFVWNSDGRLTDVA